MHGWGNPWIAGDVCRGRPEFVPNFSERPLHFVAVCITLVCILVITVCIEIAYSQHIRETSRAPGWVSLRFEFTCKRIRHKRYVHGKNGYAHPSARHSARQKDQKCLQVNVAATVMESLSGVDWSLD